MRFAPAESRPRRATPALLRWVWLRGLLPLVAACSVLGSVGARAEEAAASNDKELTAEESSAVAEDAPAARRTLQDRIRAVSRRVFLKRQRFELVPTAGLQANDPFTRPYALGARLSYHFNEEFALDLGGGYVPPFFVQELQDVRLVGGDLSALDKARAENPTLIGYFDAGVTFSPFYGKFALMSEHVVHFDGFISAGLGAVFDDGPSIVHPAIELGVGARVFLAKWLTVRADVRNYTYPLFVDESLSFPSVLMLTLGAGIHIPFDFDYSTEVIGAKE